MKDNDTNISILLSGQLSFYRAVALSSEQDLQILLTLNLLHHQSVAVFSWVTLSCKPTEWTEELIRIKIFHQVKRKLFFFSTGHCSVQAIQSPSAFAHEITGTLLRLIHLIHLISMTNNINSRELPNAALFVTLSAGTSSSWNVWERKKKGKSCKILFLSLLTLPRTRIIRETSCRSHHHKLGAMLLQTLMSSAQESVSQRTHSSLSYCLT